MARKKKCDICERAEGSTVDRGGMEDGIPLGAIEFCDLCWYWACPDCRYEADCCFNKADDHSDDPAWAPPGWRRLPRHPDGYDQWERL